MFISTRQLVKIITILIGVVIVGLSIALFSSPAERGRVISDENVSVVEESLEFLAFSKDSIFLRNNLGLEITDLQLRVDGRQEAANFTVKDDVIRVNWNSSELDFNEEHDLVIVTNTGTVNKQVKKKETTQIVELEEPYSCGDGICDYQESCSADCVIEAHCNDGIDNDLDGRLDNKDPDCDLCGNDVCESTETCSSCPEDCLPAKGECCSSSDCDEGYKCISYECVLACGDGVCGDAETCSSCPEDCLSEGNVCCKNTSIEGDCCVDSDCHEGYQCINNTCIEAVICGDSVCMREESCASDCSTELYCNDRVDNDNDGLIDDKDPDCDLCGNDVCESTETCSSCPEDCLPVDSVCCDNEVIDGDCCVSADCRRGYKCVDYNCVLACGDGLCESTETCSSCPEDCLPEGSVCCSAKTYLGDCCTKADCGEGFTCSSHGCIKLAVCGNGFCDADEDCISCPADCGECPKSCGDSVCMREESCASDCSTELYCNDRVDNDDDGLIDDKDPDCDVCGNGVCDESETCSSCRRDCLPEGWLCCIDEAMNVDCCVSADCKEDYKCVGYDCVLACGDGLCDDTETCSSCPEDCLPADSVCCNDKVISGDCCVDSDCHEGYQCTDNICIEIITCGDGVCDESETCSSCPEDCMSPGADCCIDADCKEDYKCVGYDCVPACGDGTCDNSESCRSCPEDCPCTGYCGYCSGGEANDCSDILDQDNCKLVKGCEWEPGVFLTTDSTCSKDYDCVTQGFDACGAAPACSWVNDNSDCPARECASKRCGYIDSSCWLGTCNERTVNCNKGTACSGGSCTATLCKQGVHCANGVLYNGYSCDGEGNCIVNSERIGCCSDMGCKLGYECIDQKCRLTRKESTCDDGQDNDGDGLIDCKDSDCDGVDYCEYGKELTCNDRFDNDGDGRVDCKDTNCDGELGRGGVCEYGKELTCGDRFDNDADQRMDCKDRDCEGRPECKELECSDGKDNDGDGRIDCKDPDCDGQSVGFLRTCEYGKELTCGDGFDNDADGRTDCEDRDCDKVGKCEYGEELTCGDGFDNDADGSVDYNDKDCSLW